MRTQRQTQTRVSESSIRLLTHLSQSSTPYLDPLAGLEWNKLDFNAYWIPEEAISIFATPGYTKLSERQRKLVSQCEFINFIQAGFWLESLFIERIATALRKNSSNLTESIYHLHELREESGHSLMFLELVHRAVQFAPDQQFHKLNLANMLARFAPFDSSAFWIAVLLGEEVPDRLNRFIRKHKDQVCPVITRMASIHVIDEARHIAHAKDIIAAQGIPWQTRFLLGPVINRIFSQFVDTFYYPSMEVYRAAGLDNATDWHQKAKFSMHREEFVRGCIEPTMRTIAAYGLKLNWKP